MPSTVDRADVVHFAGRHRLSPALRDGRPALVGPGETGGRCGWAEFFDAMRRERLVAAFDPEDPSSFRPVAAGGVPASSEPGAALGDAPAGRGAFAEARRFLAALRGRWPPP